jgi:hypothetical protein
MYRVTNEIKEKIKENLITYMKEKTVYDELQESKQSLPIEEEVPLLKENINILRYVLHDIELWALQEAIKNKSPMTTGLCIKSLIFSRLLGQTIDF